MTRSHPEVAGRVVVTHHNMRKGIEKGYKGML